jgi:hypothetical protein
MEKTIAECLESAEIVPDDYSTVVQALSLVTLGDRRARRQKKVDRTGYIAAGTTISKQFDRFKVLAEDRGPVYAVWILKTDEDDLTEEVMGFYEFPWEQG